MVERMVERMVELCRERQEVWIAPAWAVAEETES